MISIEEALEIDDRELSTSSGVMESWLSFGGRATRREFWERMVILILVPVLLTGVFACIAYWAYSCTRVWLGCICTIGACVTAVFGFLLSLPIMARRFHDRDMSAWWILWFYLMNLLPGIGSISCIVELVILGCLAGTDGRNRFGTDTRDQSFGDGHEAAPEQSGRSMVDRLSELNELHARGLLSESEYEAKRSELIRDI